MPFGSGASNPSAKRKSVVDAAREKARERAAERYHERKAVEVLSTGVTSLPNNNLPLSDRQHQQIALLSARPGPGVTQSNIARSIGCAQSTVSRSVRGVTYSTGNPVGRPRLTTEFEREEIRKISRRDPYGRLVDYVGPIYKATSTRFNIFQISRTLCNPLSDEAAAFKRRATNRYARFTKTLWDMHMGFREGMTIALVMMYITLDDLVYEDEFPVYYGICARDGRSDEPIYGEEDNKRGLGCLNVLATISSSKVLKVMVCPTTTNDETFMDYAMNAHPISPELPHLNGPSLIDVIPAGKILFLDRFGRAGRARKPSKCHYNPRLREALLNKGVGMDLLPPKGAEFNPIELFNGWVQRQVLRWQPRGRPMNTFGQKIRGPRTRAEAITALNDVLAKLKDKNKIKLLRYWYHRRMTGSDAFKRWMASPEGRRMLQEREENATREIYDLAARAFRPELFNIHDPEDRDNNEERGGLLDDDEVDDTTDEEGDDVWWCEDPDEGSSDDDVPLVHFMRDQLPVAAEWQPPPKRKKRAQKKVVRPPTRSSLTTRFPLTPKKKKNPKKQKKIFFFFF